MGNTARHSWTGTRGENYTVDRDNPSLSMELGSGNLGSHREVMTVILWGLMSSEVELGAGVTREV